MSRGAKHFAPEASDPAPQRHAGLFLAGWHDAQKDWIPSLSARVLLECRKAIPQSYLIHPFNCSSNSPPRPECMMILVVMQLRFWCCQLSSCCNCDDGDSSACQASNESPSRWTARGNEAQACCASPAGEQQAEEWERSWACSPVPRARAARQASGGRWDGAPRRQVCRAQACGDLDCSTRQIISLRFSKGLFPSQTSGRQRFTKPAAKSHLGHHAGRPRGLSLRSIQLVEQPWSSREVQHYGASLLPRAGACSQMAEP